MCDSFCFIADMWLHQSRQTESVRDAGGGGGGGDSISQLNKFTIFDMRSRLLTGIICAICLRYEDSLNVLFLLVKHLCFNILGTMTPHCHHLHHTYHTHIHDKRPSIEFTLSSCVWFSYRRNRMSAIAIDFGLHFSIISFTDDCIDGMNLRCEERKECQMRRK